MSKPRYRWWIYVKNTIRAYPTHKQNLEEMHRMPVTSSASGMPGSPGGVNRRTEDIALRQLPPQDQREYDAVQKAVNATKAMQTGQERLQIISLVFWKKSHTLDGAAMKVNVSASTAAAYHWEFIMMVGFFLGFISQDELNEEIRKRRMRTPV